MGIVIKWILIVTANAILGFYLGYESGEDVSGILLGIFTWMILYMLLDFYLIRKGLITLSKRLTLSTCLRIPLQGVGYVDFLAGMAATFTVEPVFGIYDYRVPATLLSYLYTFFTGFYLSLVCGVIFLIVTWVTSVRTRRN